MKKLLILFFFLLMISCKTENTKPQNPNFLIGNWIRTNDEEGNKTYENWAKDLTGLGYTLKGKDTTFIENMSIITNNDTLFLKVDGINEDSTFFKFTQQTDSSFVCENPENEFPKKIHYYLDNKQLKADVSNPDFNIEFIFNRIEK